MGSGRLWEYCNSGKRGRGSCGRSHDKNGVVEVVEATATNGIVEAAETISANEVGEVAGTITKKKEEKMGRVG